jgi:hypothetical protein
MRLTVIRHGESDADETLATYDLAFSDGTFGPYGYDAAIQALTEEVDLRPATARRVVADAWLQGRQEWEA